MKAARRRVLRQTLGLAGYVLIAGAVVENVAVLSVYAYRAVVAARAEADATAATELAVSSSRAAHDAAYHDAGNEAAAPAERATRIKDAYVAAIAAVRSPRDPAQIAAAHAIYLEAMDTLKALNAELEANADTGGSDDQLATDDAIAEESLGTLHQRDAGYALHESVVLGLRVSIVSLTPLAVAGILFWMRHRIGLADGEERA
jgi:hypothetical protein